MTSTAKNQNKLPGTTMPRVTPRPTAASAARAARNATNRNLNSTTSKTSPSRSTTPKGKSPVHRNIGKPESDTQMIDKHDNDVFVIDDTSDAADPVSELNLVIDDKDEHQLADEPAEVNEVDNNQIVETPECRPNTPSSQPQSRPMTPKTSASRPQTPRVPSRPSTPAKHNNTPRTSTPQCVISNTSNNPTKTNSPRQPKTPRCANSINQNRSQSKDDDVNTEFSAKKQQFHRMKKELDLKQKAVIELFDNLRNLQDRMANEGITSAGGEGFRAQELVVFNVADWAAEEVSQLIHNSSLPVTDGAIDVINSSTLNDEITLTELDTKITNLPTRFADLCLKAFTARQEIIDWVKELIEKEENGEGESLSRIKQYNAEGLVLCEALRDLKTDADYAVITVTQLTLRACQERSALKCLGEALVREIAQLRSELEVKTASLGQKCESRSEIDIKLVEELRKELEKEKATNVATKDKLGITESQLRQARVRITKMDRQLREAEASITSLTGTVKSLEDQSRQKEVQLEARARKLKESLKTGEVTTSQIAQQRDTLQQEVTELKQQIENLTNQYTAQIQDLNFHIKELKLGLEAQHETCKNEKNLRERAENMITEKLKDIEELQAKITEIENSKPNPDQPTEREIDLWAELQATKDTLRVAEEEIVATKRDKLRFLETLTKISESESNVGMQQKLAAELLSKEEVISKMQAQIRELNKNVKLNEQKVIQYEQYTRDLIAHRRALCVGENSPDGVTYHDLQQEIMSLRMNLLDVVHRNEEMTELLAQKEQQLDQQDKTSRAQARVIKVNRQIAAKADEIQELFVTLENKQQQIHRLEKIILALEEQQRRAQAQRTRHEEKIAALEHELAAGPNRRERKFLFF